MTAIYGSSLCPQCGSRFDMRSPAQMYCSPTCGRAFRNGQPGRVRSYKCRECGTPGAAGPRGPLPERCDRCRGERERKRPSRQKRRRAA